MAKKKRQYLNAVSVVLGFLVLVALAASIAAFFLDSIIAESELTIIPVTLSLRLFSSDFDSFDVDRIFSISSFVIIAFGLLILVVGQIGKLTGKNINYISIIGSFIAIIGSISLVIAGLILISELQSWLPTTNCRFGTGIWLSISGGFVGGILGLLSVTRVAR